MPMNLGIGLMFGGRAVQDPASPVAVIRAVDGTPLRATDGSYLVGA